MRASDLVVGEVYAYGSREYPRKVTYTGRHEREVWSRPWFRHVPQWCHVSVDAKNEHVDKNASRYLMPWAQWEAREADRARAERERRGDAQRSALDTIRRLNPDLWHTVDTLTPEGMDTLAQALGTLAQCGRSLREEYGEPGVSDE